MKKYLPFGTWSCFQNIFVKNLRPVRGRAVWVDKNTSFGKFKVDINSGQILRVNTKKVPMTKVIFPLFGTIELTSACNLRCAHCLAARNSVEMLAHEKVISLIDGLADGGAVSVGFSGGEPTLRKDLPEIIEYASRKKKMQTLLFTNGTLLHGNLVKKLKKAGLSWMGISLDSYRADKHDDFRGVRGAFDRTLHGIKNSVAHGFNVWLRCTLTNRSDLADLDGLLELARELRVNRLYFIRVVNWGRADLNRLTLSGRKQQQMVTHIVDHLVDHPEDFAVNLKMTKSSNFDFVKYRRIIRQYQDYCDWGCGAGTIRFRITSEGFVLPCPFFPINLSIPKVKLSAGNVLRKSFGEIWKNSKYLKNYRDNLQKLEGRCGDCRFVDKWCHGGCRAESLIRSRSIVTSDPLCHYNE